MSIECISLVKGSSHAQTISRRIPSQSDRARPRWQTSEKRCARPWYQAGGLQQWVRQDRIDRGEIPGTSTTDHTELVRAKRRIRELEQELEIVKRAAKLLGEETPHPKESTR